MKRVSEVVSEVTEQFLQSSEFLEGDTLELTSDPFAGEGGDLLCKAIECHPRARKVVLSGCNWTDPIIEKVFVALSKNPNIISLDLKIYYFKYHQRLLVLANHIGNMKQLKEINLQKNFLVLSDYPNILNLFKAKPGVKIRWISKIILVSF